MATLSYEGFNNIPATDIKIDDRGYSASDMILEALQGQWEVKTGAELNALTKQNIPDANPTFGNHTYVVFFGELTNGVENDLGSYRVTFPNKAQDATGKKYDVRMTVHVKVTPVPDWVLGFVPDLGVQTSGIVSFNATSANSGVGSRGQLVVAGDSQDVTIEILDNGTPVSGTTVITVKDIDTLDNYNLTMKTPSDTGNGYRAGNGKVWEFQESVNPNMNGTVYVDPDTCEMMDETTGFIGNGCADNLGNDLISSIAFVKELPATFTINQSSGGVNLFSNYGDLRSATVTASKIGNGTISEEGDKNYLIGSNATYTMTPAEGYRIKDVKVDGTSVGAVSTYTFTDLQADHTIEVEFEKIPVDYTITATADNGGAISDAGDTTVTEGDSKTYTITPDEGYVVKDVLVDGTSVGAVTSYTFSNVDADHTIHATFEEKQGYTITTTVQGSGTVTMDGESAVGTKTVPEGSTKTLNINPKTGHKISAIILDGESITPTHTVVLEDISEDHTVVVTFRKCTNADIKPDICGGEGIYIDPPVEPGGDCDCQDQIDDLYATKQDVLTAGENITIEDGVISATFSFDLFEIVDELPETGDPNKVYLVPTEDGFEEWHYKNGKWDPVGSMHVDLTGYVKEEDVTKEYLLTKLGYEELDYSQSDCNGVTRNWKVLAREVEAEQLKVGIAYIYSSQTFDYELTANGTTLASGTATIEPDEDNNGEFTIPWFDHNEAGDVVTLYVSKISAVSDLTFPCTWDETNKTYNNSGTYYDLYVGIGTWSE